MKVALLFSGISYQEDYIHFSKKVGNINFVESFRNYTEYLFPLFEKEESDIYLSTNKTAKTPQLVNLYQPKKITFQGNTRNQRIVWGLYEILNSGAEYDLVIVTRFDLLFHLSFEYDPTTLNLMSVLEAPHLIDDNLYIFPGKYLQEFYQFAQNHYNSPFPHYHNNLKDFEQIFGWVNFIHNENRGIVELSSYSIYREWLYVFHHNIIRPLNKDRMPFSLNRELILEGFHKKNQLHQHYNIEELSNSPVLKEDVFDMRGACEDDEHEYHCCFFPRLGIFKSIQRLFPVKVLIAEKMEKYFLQFLSPDQIIIQKTDLLLERVFYPTFNFCLFQKLN